MVGLYIWGRSGHSIMSMEDRDRSPVGSIKDDSPSGTFLNFTIIIYVVAKFDRKGTNIKSRWVPHINTFESYAFCVDSLGPYPIN